MVVVDLPLAVESGEETDFVSCYTRHYGRLVKALRMAGADPGTAEETAQEAFAVALVRWNRVRRGSNPAGYVYTTGFRILRKHLARTSRWDVGDPPDQARADDDTTGASAAGRRTTSSFSRRGRSFRCGFWRSAIRRSGFPASMTARR